MTTSTKSRKLSPDTLTELWLISLGWDVVDQCQRQMGMIKRDLFGFADQMAFSWMTHVLVQSTSLSNMPSRRHKVVEHQNTRKWLESSPSNRVFIVAWKELMHRNGDTLTPRVEEVHLDRACVVSRRISDVTTCAPVRDIKKVTA